MASSPRPADLVAAHIAFWREAGVDDAFDDAPANWLEQPVQRKPRDEALSEGGKAPTDRAKRASPPFPQAPPLPDITMFREQWPMERDAFEAWWLSEPRLALPGAGAAIGMFGPVGAALAIVLPQPLGTDPGGLPNDGLSSRLVRDFMRSAGVEPDDVLVLPALRSALPVPEWTALAAAGWGSMLRHRLALNRPQRVIAFGEAIRSLLENEPSHGARGFDASALCGGDMRMAIAPSLDLMLANPRAKARFWKNWIEWTER